MSNPSFSNIDRWLFELMEGNLSPEQVAQLEAFLLKHPELDVDRDMWELAKIPSQVVEYPNREQLIKRRPVGLYMSLGFASIALMISLGFYSSLGDFANLRANELLFADNTEGTVELLQDKSGNLKEALSVGKRSKYQTGNSVIGEKRPEFERNGSAPSTRFNHVPIDQFARQINPGTSIEPPFMIAIPDVFKDKSEGSDIQNSQRVLQTFEPTVLVLPLRESSIIRNSSSIESSRRFDKTEYKLSFSSKLSRIGRKVQRMLDNPVALKNMKDPHYHVPGMQATDINYGAVGTLLGTRVQTMTRAQWVGQSNQQFTNRLVVDGYSYGMRGGIGFQFDHNYYSDGMIQNFMAAMIYSPKFSVSRNVVVEPSVRFKMGSKNLDWSKVNFGEDVEYDRMNTQSFVAGFGEPLGNQLWYRDLGLGLMVNTKWFFAGIQGDNLFKHYDNIYQYDPANPRRAGKHFVATVGTDYQSYRENFTLSPYAVYQQQENLSEGWLGFNMKYRWMTVGGAISSNLEPAASVGVKLDRFTFTYNADYIQSEMLQNRGLSHQLTIRFLSKPGRVGQRLLNQ